MLKSISLGTADC